jgi:hypothetical protein
MEKTFEEKAGRGAHSLSQIGELEPLGNQRVSEPEIDPAPEPRHLRFERVNEVTVKVTDGRITMTPTPPGRHWAGYKTTRAVAWLAAVGAGRWIVRCRNKTSRPMVLAKARRYASELIKGIRPGIVLDDPIGHLNRISVIEPPSAGQITDIMGGQHRGCLDREFRDRIVEIETGSALVMPAVEITDAPLSGNDYPLEYYEDGYPKLPAFWDRRLAREAVLK